MKIITPLEHVNLAHLSEMCGDDEETMRELLTEIRKEIPVEIEKINRASNARDWEDVFQISHKLKTTFGFLDNGELNKLVKVTEFSSRHKIDVEEIPGLVKKITHHANLVMCDIEGYGL